MPSVAQPRAPLSTRKAPTTPTGKDKGATPRKDKGATPRTSPKKSRGKPQKKGKKSDRKPELPPDTSPTSTVTRPNGRRRHYEEAGGAALNFTPGVQSMSQLCKDMLLVKPSVQAPLDPGFSPLVLAKKAYLAATSECADKLEWALPRQGGCARYALPVFAEGDARVEVSIYLAGVLIQEMIWQRSASALLLCGPPAVCAALHDAFSVGGAYDFEVQAMPKVCGTPLTPFLVSLVGSPESLPEERCPRT